MRPWWSRSWACARAIHLPRGPRAARVRRPGSRRTTASPTPRSRCAAALRLNKTTSTAPLDRVRSVNLEACLLHHVHEPAEVAGRHWRRRRPDHLDALVARRKRRPGTAYDAPAPARRRAARAGAVEDRRRRPRSDRPAPPCLRASTGPGCGSLPSASPGSSCSPARWAWWRSSATTCPHLERGDRDVGVGVGHPVRRRDGRPRARRGRARPVARGVRGRLRRAVVGLPARARARLAAPEELRALHDALDHRRDPQGPRRPPRRPAADVAARETRPSPRWSRTASPRCCRRARATSRSASASRCSTSPTRGPEPLRGRSSRQARRCPRRHRRGGRRLVVPRLLVAVGARRRRRRAAPRRGGGRGVVPPPRARPARAAPHHHGAGARRWRPTAGWSPSRGGSAGSAWPT